MILRQTGTNRILELLSIWIKNLERVERPKINRLIGIIMGFGNFRFVHNKTIPNSGQENGTIKGIYNW